MNIEALRNDTPGCHDTLFLNSAGASLMTKEVVDSMKSYLDEEATIGGYKLAALQSEEINAFYNEAARLIHCEPRNIAFAYNATEAYAKALSSIHFKENDVIITSDYDYVSNYMYFITLQKRFGIRVVRSRHLEDKRIDIPHFKTLVEQYHPKLVAITHVPTSSGLIQNVEEIGAICAQYHTLYLVDACQSAGQLQLDVKKIQCDFLSVTGRKFLRGPRGTGFLYVSDKLLEANYAPMSIDLRGATWNAPMQYQMIDSAKRFETWELPYAALIGFKVALAYANTLGIPQIRAYNSKLMNTLRENIVSIPKVTCYDKETEIANILTFRKIDTSLEHTKHVLDNHGVYYSIAEKESALIDFNKRGVDWAIRLSPHYFNTLEEMNNVSEIINTI